MDENEFKKLTAAGRDWLIYSLLSAGSGHMPRGTKDVSMKKLAEEIEQDMGEHVSGVDLEEPKGETTVQETVTGKVVLVTDLAVLIGNDDRGAWFPKSTILNLDKIVLDKGKTVELKIVDWFKYKIEWKAIKK